MNVKRSKIRSQASVRRIFDLYLHGMGMQQIADLLNAEGVPRAYRKDSDIWKMNTIHYILKNEKYMQYETIWPDKFECLETAIDYFENPIAFKQELQNDASNIGEKWFKSIRTIPREEIENETFTKTMLLVDPASTSKSTSDYSAFLVGSLSENGFKYARWSELAKINARTDFDKYVDHMIELLKSYSDITHVYIEKNTFNGADANQLEHKILKEPSLRYRNITIISITSIIYYK